MTESAVDQPSTTKRQGRPMGLIPLFAYTPREHGHEQREDFLKDISDTVKSTMARLGRKVDLTAPYERQLQHHLEALAGPYVAASKWESNCAECIRHVHIECTLGSNKFVDDLEWDLADPTASPLQYAARTASDLGLGWDAVRTIAEAMTAKLNTLRAEESGGSTAEPKQDGAAVAAKAEADGGAGVKVKEDGAAPAEAPQEGNGAAKPAEDADSVAETKGVGGGAVQPETCIRFFRPSGGMTQWGPRVERVQSPVTQSQHVTSPMEEMSETPQDKRI